MPKKKKKGVLLLCIFFLNPRVEAISGSTDNRQKLTI